MQPIQSPLHHANLTQKRILLRADLNVPLKNGAILSDERLKALLPTLNLIHQKNGKIILLTHIDRPEKVDPSLSTKMLIPWLNQQGFSVTFEADLDKACEKSFHDPKTILLLENLRFYPGEKSCDPQFAKKLSRLGDIFVNDAFGMLARTDCSVIALPQLFAPNNRMFGLLIEKELTYAHRLLHNPERPYTLIIGGNKVADKIPLIERMLPHLDYLLLCPALVFTFLKAQNKPVGNSLVELSAVDLCKKIEEFAGTHKTRLVYPVDFLVSDGNLSGPYHVKKTDALSPQDYGIAIGPETQTLFGTIIKQSKTCVYNGLMGDVSIPESLQAAQNIFESMAQSHAYTIIAGGDSIAAAHLLGFNESMSYLSTGGGALVAYISGKPLPALDLVLNK